MYLQQLGIAYERFDHPPIFTCEEAERLAPAMPGAHTKNLFLRDRKGTRHILVVVGPEKSVDLKTLAARIGADKLSFASAERLRQHLGVDPGSVTVLGLINDQAHRVDVIIDEAVWRAESVLCHPLVNTASLAIPHEGLERFLQTTGHVAEIIDVPTR